MTFRLLAAIIAVRLAATPWHRYLDIPGGLWFPVPIVRWLSGPPATGVILAVQLVGIAAACAAALDRRPQAAFAVAWVAYLFLAALRSSRGKLLHNDLLPLWVTAVLVVVPLARALRPAIVVTALIYFFAGFQKLRRTGLEWITGDNLAWAIRWGPQQVEPGIPAVADWVGGHTAVAQLGAALLVAVELTFPAVIWLTRLRPWFAVAAVGLHAGTWVLLGLDYWVWAAVVAVVLLDGVPAANVMRRLGNLPRRVGRGRGSAAG